MSFSWRLATVLGAAGCFLSFGTVEGASSSQSNIRQPAAVSHQGHGDCPTLCSLSGLMPANWTAYHNLDQLAYCQQVVFYHFSIYDTVDNSSTPHRIYACTSYGTPQKYGLVMEGDKVAQNNTSFTLGRWNDNASQGVDISAISSQMQSLLSAGYTASKNKPLVLFAQTVSGTAGLYMGKSVQFQPTGSGALTAMENALYASNHTCGSVALQLCEAGYDADHIIGFIAISNMSFTPVQRALQSWANATCLRFDTTQNVNGTTTFTTPLVLPSSAAANATGMTNTTNTTNTTNRDIRDVASHRLKRRGDCTTIQVASGDSCGSLATKCGILPTDFTTYNPSSTLCSSLMPGQHVCCSAGTMPDFAPKPYANGSCSAYTIAADDTCSSLAAIFSITTDDIENYNNNTWAWGGCDLLYVGNIICLSSGTPPMPAPLANAVCGPQMPGTTMPASGMANISDLNPCPLNACCNVWGQCGITAEFCTNTNTGAPGTAKPGTNGCISNCGTDVLKSGPPAEFISLAYYEGFGMDRPCLYQDVRQINTTQFTHVHFAFAALDTNYSVTTGDALSMYEFNAFLRLSDIKRVVSFGGWAFSTDPSTYNIFRSGVTAENRMTMAMHIANFIVQYGLDGVDIDWEYPGEPDIPGIPAGSEEDGTNFLEFLVALKNLLPEKTVSIAVPASYWYLKSFPIAEISKVVDYIVFMTYDLHGQWDAGNRYSQDGCSTGMCLRSHVNLTETMTALAMITKAGVPSNKVVVGVSSYGRSFAMAEAECYGPNCLFTGTAARSNAEEGPCTQTAGYLADAEINAIINDTSRVNDNFIDDTSNSRILVYDSIQWVAFMDNTIRSERQLLYSSLDMGGTTNWASDLEKYNDAPDTQSSWSSFFINIKGGIDPYAEGNRTGNWTSIKCTDLAVENIRGLSPSQRWSEMDGPDAWADVVNVFTQYDNGTVTFTMSVSDTIHGPEDANCGSLAENNNCDQTLQCNGFVGGGSGAAGYEIWNSMVNVHEMYASYQDALTIAAAMSLDPALANFEDTFAPVPPPPNDEWLEILLDVIDLVGTVAVSAFFNSILKSLPYFEANKADYDNGKDTSKALVAFGVSMTSALTKTSGDWTASDQAAFSDYIGQAVLAWSNITENSLGYLFSGTADAVNLLTTLIANGEMIEGSVNGASASPNMTASEETLNSLAAVVAKGFFAYAIPTVWPLAGTNAFILDSGYPCGTVYPNGGSDLVAPDNQNVTGGCYNGNQYFLVYPSGSATVCDVNSRGPTLCNHNQFSPPPGIEALDGSNFGGVTVDDLITGSLRTYTQNGNTNGGGSTDPTNNGSLHDLMNGDITTPGFIRLPVCSGDEAWTAWSTVSNRSEPNWPCYVKPAINDCGNSSFVDQTSEGSPTTTDCLQIVQNIQGTQGQWEVYNSNAQHQIVGYGTCNFGVQGVDMNGNSNYYVGAQDIVDLINDSVKQFGGSGLVSAKGDMNCRGDISTAPVVWGIY